MPESVACTQCGSRLGSSEFPCLAGSCGCRVIICAVCLSIFAHVGDPACTCCDVVFGSMPS